jgi:low temperature requirement protein LtrA
VLFFSLLGIFIVFGLWWLYFDDLEGSRIRAKPFAPYAWIYAHLPLTLGITAFGVASKKVFQSVGQAYPVKAEYVALYCGSLVVFALAAALLEAAVEQPGERGNGRLRVMRRLGAAAALAVALFFGGQLSALPLAAGVAAIFLAVMLAEEWGHIRQRLRPAGDQAAGG